MNKLNLAFKFAFDAHDGQYRKYSKLPFIIHPYDVVHRLSSIGINDEDMLISGVLHDTVEDTNITSDDIHNIFGLKISKIVDELTMPETSVESTKRKWLNHIASHCSIEANIIKFTDRMSNFHDFLSANNKNAKLYAESAAPIYRRLMSDSSVDRYGSSIRDNIKRELEIHNLI